jgi:class 3 adenylate cyclase/tetratricopeptide (TPR) repeat protein
MVKCPNCHEENPEKFRLCGYCGTPLHADAPAQAHLIRRTVSLIFCDLKDSTALGERLDPEALHEVKDRYFDAMAAEIRRHGGKIEKYIGDAIMAVFGLPVQHEDDALRAVRAAAGMRAVLGTVNEQLRADYDVTLANRTGVNTGEVVANDDPAADQKLATGDAVNVTARLEQAAPANEIYIGEGTWRLVRDAVEVEVVPPLELKGKHERVPAFRLISVAGRDGTARRHDLPIVGRDGELRAIDGTLREVVATGSARLITLVGDAGIGKSRLAQEVIARAGATARVVRGRCLAYGEGITFWPLREIVADAAAILVTDATEQALDKISRFVGDGEVAARLAAAIGLTHAAFPPHETLWATRKFFGTLAQGGSLVALVDDIHWAEGAFLDLLQAVLHADDTAAVLLLCTARHDLLEKRPEWGQGERALRLVLQPLTDDAAASVAQNVLGSAGVPADVVARIVAAAEGNPLYVEQMLSMLVDNRVLRRQDGRWTLAGELADMAVPPSIHALLEARIGQLHVEERTVVDPASVIGMEFPVPAVSSMIPERLRPAVVEQLAVLTRKQLVNALPKPGEDLVYRFQHHLVRDTIYNSLLKRTRATLHVDFVRWADVVNAERGRGLEFEAILGYHLEQAQRYLRELGPLDARGKEIGRDASRRLAAAGRRAFAGGDAQAAENLLRRAVATLDNADPLRTPLLPDLAEVLLELGQFGDARALTDQVFASPEGATDRRVKASAEVVRTLVWLHSGDNVNWTDVAATLSGETIPALAGEGAHDEVAKAWRVVALVQQNAGQLGVAAESIAKVVEHARLAGNQRLVARSALGLALGALHGPTAVPKAIEQCEALIAEDIPDRQVQNLIVCKIAHLRAMNDEDVDEARSMCRSARDVLRDLGRGVRAASASLDLAAIELLAGDAAAAEREVRPDCELLEKMGETFFLSTMAAMLARAVREQGRDDEALEITRLAERTAAPNDMDAQALWRSVRAPILARSGAHEEAEALARASIGMAKQLDTPALHASAWSELAAVLQLRGRDGEARAALADALRIYEAKGDRVSVRRLRAAITS